MRSDMGSRGVYSVRWRSRRTHVAARPWDGQIAMGMSVTGFRSARGAHFLAPWRMAWALLVAALLCCGTVRSFAQTVLTLQGTVTDISGAVIPGATVTARPVAGGVAGSATTDGEGGFQIAGLAKGETLVTATAAGFAAAQATVTLGAQAVPLHLTLNIAQANETVSVTAAGASIETSSTETGGTLDAQQMEMVPLNGRSFTDALAVQPGVTPTSAAQPNAIVMSGVASTPPSGQLDSGSLSIGGQRETANSFRVNGADAQEDVNMGVAIVPTLDSIAELNVATGNYAPEYGSASGGQVLVTTRSGTNTWRGSLLEYLRNTDLDARNYFSLERGAFHQNQFGATLGGPVKKDRLYLFADYQGTRLAEGVDTGLISVPTAAERAGDFATGSGSLLTGCVGGPYLASLLTQKLGRGVAAGDPYSPASAGCVAGRPAVFADSVIPQSIWSTAAQHLLSSVPQGNVGAGTFSTSSAEQSIRDDK